MAGRNPGSNVSTAAQRAGQLDLVARLKSAYPELPDAPSPDLLDHERFVAYTKPVHDVGGEPDAPMKYENKGYEYWEHMTYVMCEVLAWRGIWLSEERRRMGNVDNINNAVDINKDSPGNPGNIRFRHMGNRKANCLMMDGHVQAFDYNKTTQTTELLRKNVSVPPP